MSIYSDNAEYSKVIMNVKHQLQNGALPQKCLTGLVFCLIPGWVIRPAEFIYSLTNDNNGKYHS